MAGLSSVQKALLDTISGPESKGNYGVIYGGNTFDDFSDHPRQSVLITSGPNKGKYSSAAGKYQFIGSTWDDIAGRYGIPDFSPASQDQAAWALANEEYKRDTGRDLASDLAAGDLSRVPESLKNQWTSLPGGIEQGIGKNAFANAYAANLGKPVTPAPDKPAGGGWLSALVGGGVNSALDAIKTQAAPIMRKAEQAGPAAFMQAMGTLEGRSAIGRYLTQMNVAKPPVMVSGFQPGGSQVMAVNNHGSSPATLMRATDGSRGGVTSQAFDNQFHGGQNMDVYRANAAAVGGGGNLNQAGIQAALMRGATLMRSANGGNSGGQSLSTMSGARSVMET